MKFFNRCIAAALVLFLSGCVTRALVKDITADPKAYLTNTFNETKLSDSVRNALGIKTPGNVKREVHVDAVMTIIDGEQKHSFDKTEFYQVLDNGLVRSMVQAGNNGITSISEFDLTYHDIFALIYQSVSHDATTAFAATYTKGIAKLDKGIADPKENAEYVFEYALAPEPQIVNFENQKTVCKTGKWFAANTVHPKLTGNALPIDCEYFGRNGQTFLKLRSVFIKDLGVTLKRESVTSTRKRTWTIRDVKT
ncbi:MAG: hypothetical protein ACJ8NR_09045 [Sulfurifustis sp.]